MITRLVLAAGSTISMDVSKDSFLMGVTMLLMDSTLLMKMGGVVGGVGGSTGDIGLDTGEARLEESLLEDLVMGLEEVSVLGVFGEDLESLEVCFGDSLVVAEMVEAEDCRDFELDLVFRGCFVTGGETGAGAGAAADMTEVAGAEISPEPLSMNLLA